MKAYDDGARYYPGVTEQDHVLEEPGYILNPQAVRSLVCLETGCGELLHLSYCGL